MKERFKIKSYETAECLKDLGMMILWNECPQGYVVDKSGVIEMLIRTGNCSKSSAVNTINYLRRIGAIKILRNEIDINEKFLSEAMKKYQEDQVLIHLPDDTVANKIDDICRRLSILEAEINKIGQVQALKRDIDEIKTNICLIEEDINNLPPWVHDGNDSKKEDVKVKSVVLNSNSNKGKRVKSTTEKRKEEIKKTFCRSIGFILD